MIVAVRNRLRTWLKLGWSTINESNILLGIKGAAGVGVGVGGVGSLCGIRNFNKRKVPKTVHGRILSIKWEGMYNIIKRSLNERQKQAAVENEEQTEGREGRKGAQWLGWPTVLTGKKGISPFSLLIKSYRTERKMTNKKPLIPPNVTVWTPFWSLFNNSPLPSPFVSLRFHHFVCKDIKTFSVKAI